jgi:uncharacterized DUF497 family protein
MEFDWDPHKSVTNEAKHGIDFVSAQSLWADENRIEIQVPYPIEDRMIMIAGYEGKVWAAVYTVRGDTIRIISVRRARKKEADLYEEKNAGQDE